MRTLPCPFCGSGEWIYHTVKYSMCMKCKSKALREIWNDRKSTTKNLPIYINSVDEWINVGILYPEFNVNVLLTDGKNIGFGYLAENERYRHWKSHQDLGWITHWMHLPQPPKEI